MIACPRIVIAGTGSGVGKTSIALALVSALRKRGLKVQSFKAGPDFLDPSFHALASGRPCFNLDGWMMGKEYLLSLFARKTADADIAVIEGVMGLYDGADAASSAGSTAELARWLDAPVVLVVDAAGVARSIAATVKGYCELEPGIRIAGVVANRAGSPKHGKILSGALESCHLPKLFGFIAKGSLPSLPGRHLGLVKADAERLPRETLERFAAALEESVSVDGIIAVAKGAGRVAVAPSPTLAPSTRAVKVGLAHDEAFNFYYQDTLETMEQAGCAFSRFSPVDDEALPEGMDALIFGGGYPEEHAPALAANGKMLDAVREFAASGKPVYAECGGLMYLSRGIELAGGSRHPLAGILPAWTKMNRKFTALGYADVELKSDTLVGGAGTRLRGHRFHYSQLLARPEGWETAYSLTGKNAGVDEGYRRGNVLASYVHLHLASRPGSIECFINKCAERP